MSHLLSKITKKFRKQKEKIPIEKGIPTFSSEEEKNKILRELRELREEALRRKQRDITFVKKVPKGTKIIVPDYGVFGEIVKIRPQRNIKYLSERVKGDFGYIIYFRRKFYGKLCAIIVNRDNFRPTDISKNIFLPVMPYKLYDNANVYGENVEFYDWEPYDWEGEIKRRIETLETTLTIYETFIEKIMNSLPKQVDTALQLNARLRYLSKAKKKPGTEMTTFLPEEAKEALEED